MDRDTVTPDLIHPKLWFTHCLRGTALNLKIPPISPPSHSLFWCSGPSQDKVYKKNWGMPTIRQCTKHSQISAPTKTSSLTMPRSAAHPLPPTHTKTPKSLSLYMSACGSMGLRHASSFPPAPPQMGSAWRFGEVCEQWQMSILALPP